MFYGFSFLESIDSGLIAELEGISKFDNGVSLGELFKQYSSEFGIDSELLAKLGSISEFDDVALIGELFEQYSSVLGIGMITIGTLVIIISLLMSK